jgi:hypothetical protein
MDCFTEGVLAMEVSDAQQRLACLWLCGGAISAVILIIQSIAGYYGDKFSDAWSWLLPYVLPTLTLIISAVVADAREKTSDRTVDLFAYRSTFWLSVFYLLCLDVSLLAGNFTPYGPLQLMKMSVLWLGPLQGLIGIALGVFFVKRKNSQNRRQKAAK